MRLATLALFLLLSGLISTRSSECLAQVKAFPEAEGYGAIASGGRGGVVYHVTSLGDDANTFGTLRHGLEQHALGQPITIVFDVDGYITLNSKLGITRDNVTIAGQTAPGGGIALNGDQMSVGAENVIIRHVRFRPGKSAGRVDSLSISSGQNVIFDHISAGFSWDENASANGLTQHGIRNLTLQNSSVSYGLEDHSAGSLIQNSDNLSYHHNLYAHNHTRNPKARVEEGGIEWIGNVVYDYNNGFIAGGSSTTEFFWKASVYGNTYITGPGDTGRPIVKDGQVQNYGLYFGTNAYDNDGDAVHDPTDFTGNGVDGTGLAGVVSGTYTWAAMPYGDTKIWLENTTQEAYLRTLDNFGATPWNRDEVDTLVYNNVINRQGALIDREGDIDTTPDAGEYTLDDVVSNGGFGTLAPGVAPTDTDQDGMPDAWENSNSLNPTNAGDRNNVHPSGYTMLEIYLNELGNQSAGTTTWAAASGTWNEVAKWTNGVGYAYDEVHVHGTGSSSAQVQVNPTSGPASALRLRVGGNGTATGEEVVVTGETLTVMDSITLGDQNHGKLQLNSGTVRAESFLLGSSSAASGTLNMAGGTVETTRLVTLPDAGGNPQWNWSGGAVLRPRRDDYEAITNDSQRRSMTIESDVTLGTGGGVFDTNGHNADFIGAISGTGSLTKQGAGVLTLNNGNSFSGPLHIQEGSIKINNAAAVVGSSNIRLDAGTELEVAAAGNTLFLPNGQTLTGKGTVVGDVNATSGSVVRPLGDLTGTVHTVGVQAEDLSLGSDWAVFDDAVHGTGAGGSYNGNGLSGDGVIHVTNQSLAAPLSSGLLSATVDIPEAGTWYLFARVAAPSNSIISGDPAVQTRGNNSLWVSGNPASLQTTATNFEEVQSPEGGADSAVWVRLSPSLTSMGPFVWDPENEGIDYNLAAGQHTFTVGAREVGTVLDGFVLTTANLDSFQLDTALNGSSGFFLGDTLTVDGDYSQLSGASMAIELGTASDYNKLTVTGSADLSGILEIDLVNGFQPRAGDAFEILSADGGLSGTFDEGILWPALDGLLQWSIDYDYGVDRVVVEVSSPLSADFDGDGDVDVDDLDQWELSYAMDSLGDANGDGITDGLDFLLLQQQYTGDLSLPLSAVSATVPEPSALILLGLGLVLPAFRRCRQV